MRLIQKFAKGVLRELPDEGRSIKSAIHKLRMHKDIAKGGVMRRLGGAILPDPHTVYWIDTDRIESHTCQKTHSDDWEDAIFDQSGRVPRVQGGDWDIALHSVSEMRICRAVWDRVRHGTAWSSTEYYKFAVRQIKTGRTVWECSDQTAFDKHCCTVDQLIDSIAKHGYRDAATLPPSAAGASFSVYREIVVNLGRDGSPLFQDGRHRLAIARATGVKRVPVQVLVRHSEWQSFREFMHRMARSQGGASKRGTLYQAPLHFDLNEIPYAHACEDRWNAMRECISGGVGVALDIGCNLGFFCHRLEAIGYSCIGVEYFPDIAEAARRIAVAEGRTLRVVNGDILLPSTLEEVGTSEFSIVNALNIFHHFVKTEEGFHRLRQLLGRIRTETMFFEPHLADDSQMRGVYANPEPNEFVALIQEWSGLKRATPIHVATDGRAVFRLDQQCRGT